MPDQRMATLDDVLALLTCVATRDGKLAKQISDQVHELDLESHFTFLVTAAAIALEFAEEAARGSGGTSLEKLRNFARSAALAK